MTQGRAWALLRLGRALGLGGIIALALTQPLPRVAAQSLNAELPQRRVVLADVPNDFLPRAYNVWACACDTDGCWPGCFTVASANVLKFWALRGYSLLWDGDELGTLQRLRDHFPNLFCYNNRDDDGKPSDSGYDVFDVVFGLRRFIEARGYAFEVQPVPNPTFAQIVAEIDAGRPIIGAFGISPWGSHAGTIVGYDTTGAQPRFLVRPHWVNQPDAELVWGQGYRDLSLIILRPREGSDGPLALQQYEVVVDDADPGASFTGDWQSWTTGLGSTARYTLAADPVHTARQEETASFTWTPTLPFDGLWEVSAWVPREDNSKEATWVATYHIVHAEGMHLVRRSQQHATRGWMSLGVYPFARGLPARVRLTNLTGEEVQRTVWADAVKFTWRAPLVVQDEAGELPPALVVAGRRYLIPDPQTFEALRLDRAWVRKLPALALAQYPLAGRLPSVMARWVGVFYNNTLLSPPMVAVDEARALRFHWEGQSPTAGVGARDFSVRWTRYFALAEGEHPIRVEALGGVRVWVNGQLVISAWDAPTDLLVAHEKTVNLPAGLHRVDVEFVARGDRAQLRFGNLPPNAPIAAMPAITWTNAPTVTLMWHDAGDPDEVSDGKALRFFATLWHESGWRAQSGWITETRWTAALPLEGRYQWHVIATDGLANSAPSTTQSFIVDRRMPWAQMQAALTAKVADEAVPLTPIDALRLITDVQGNAIVAATSEAVLPSVEEAQVVSAQRALSERFGRLPAVVLRWWGSDVPHDPPLLTYDVQAREIIRARTHYTLTTEQHVVTRTSYELVLEGAREITVPVVVTEVVELPAVVPIVDFVPIPNAEWVTIASGLRVTETLFIGRPGSTYEFRVRATDAAGNTQPWHDGYAVRAEIDPRTVLRTLFLPLMYSSATTATPPRISE
ncbi:MAG: PA14 domain-containing protein [Thermoflexales bacterium]|nr:PA14 domain-containing protein [Thermoflexales bacterium]